MEKGSQKNPANGALQQTLRACGDADGRTGRRNPDAVAATPSPTGGRACEDAESPNQLHAVLSCSSPTAAPPKPFDCGLSRQKPDSECPKPEVQEGKKQSVFDHNPNERGVAGRRGTGPPELCDAASSSADGLAATQTNRAQRTGRRRKPFGLAATPRGGWTCEHTESPNEIHSTAGFHAQSTHRIRPQARAGGKHPPYSTTSPCKAPCCALTAWRNLKLAVRTRQVLPANAKTKLDSRIENRDHDRDHRSRLLRKLVS